MCEVTETHPEDLVDVYDLPNSSDYWEDEKLDSLLAWPVVVVVD